MPNAVMLCVVVMNTQPHSQFNLRKEGGYYSEKSYSIKGLVENVL
jgi:hypothetical protein